MSELNDPGQRLRCVSELVFLLMREVGMKMAIEDEAIVKNMGGFYSADMPYTPAPRCLSFTLDGNNPPLSEKDANEVKGKIQNFVRNVNRGFNLRESPLEVDFKDDDLTGQLKTIRVGIEPLLENPDLFARVIAILKRRHAINGGCTALASAAAWRLSDKIENDVLRWAAKIAAAGGAVMGARQAYNGTYKQVKIPYSEEIVDTLERKLNDDMSPGR